MHQFLIVILIEELIEGLKTKWNFRKLGGGLTKTRKAEICLVSAVAVTLATDLSSEQG
jgi:hypothetical protein